MTIEGRVRDAFAVADAFEPSPDLFARVRGSIEEDRAYRRRRARVLLAVTAWIAVLAIVLMAGWAADGTRLPFWAIQVTSTALMVSVVVVGGPVIRRYGERFEAAVFHADPATGSHVLRLLDIAYYLVFGAYVLMTLRFAPTVPWAGTGRIIGEELDRIGGLLLLMGLMHAALVLALPVVGLVFTANERRIRRARAGLPKKGTDLVVERIDTVITVLAWIAGALLALDAIVIVIQLVLGLSGM